MSYRMSVSFLCIAIVVGSASAQENLRQLLPTDEAVARNGLVRRWYSYAPVDGARETVQRVMVAGNQIHLQTNASRLYVFDSETGKQLWSAQLGTPLPGQFGSALNSKSVFAINGSSLYRLSRDEGAMIWSIRLPESPNAAPAADEERVIVSTRNGRIYVYNINTREVVWFYQTNGPISIPAALLDDKYACASADGKMYVFQPSSRNPLFRYYPETHKPVSAPMGVWGRTVLVPSQDYNVYAVDARNGETLWRYSAGNEIRRALTVIDDEVYVAPEDNGMHVLNVENGSRLWWHPRAQEFVTASKSRVYAADDHGQLLMLDRANGRQLGVMDTHRFDFRVLNDSSDRLILVTKGGLIVCLHEKENNEPVMHKKIQAASPAGIEVKKRSTKEPKAP